MIYLSFKDKESVFQSSCLIFQEALAIGGHVSDESISLSGCVVQMPASL